MIPVNFRMHNIPVHIDAVQPDGAEKKPAPPVTAMQASFLLI
jgi:hypothetical protein